MNADEFNQMVDGFIAEVDLRLRSWPRMSACGARIAVVGSGPLGLSCARFLAQCGCEVVVYESNDRSGGLMRLQASGNPRREARLDEAVAGLFTGTGVRVVCGREVDPVELAAIATWYNIVYIATGTSLGRFGLDADRHRQGEGSLVHAGDYPNVLVNGSDLDNPTGAATSVEAGEAAAFEINRMLYGYW